MAMEENSMVSIAVCLKSLMTGHDSMLQWMALHDETCQRILNQQAQMREGVGFLVETASSARVSQPTSAANLGDGLNGNVADSPSAVEAKVLYGDDDCRVSQDRLTHMTSSMLVQHSASRAKHPFAQSALHRQKTLESWEAHHFGSVPAVGMLPGHRLEVPMTSARMGETPSQVAEAFIGRKTTMVAAARTSSLSYGFYHPQHVHSHNAFLHLLEEIAEHRLFEVASAIVIVSHSLFIGGYVNYLAVVDGDGHWAFSVLNILLTALFFLEVMIKLGAERQVFVRGPEKYWNYFDLSLLLLVFVELAIGIVCSDDQCKTHLQTVLKVGELLRTFRTVRIFRFLRVSSTLSTILSKVYGSFKALGWVTCLFVMILYVLSVIITQGFNYSMDGVSRDEKLQSDVAHHFGSVDRSMYTIFCSFTGGQMWREIADDVAHIGWWYGVVFVAFMAFCTFFMLNIITGIFVDNAGKAALDSLQRKEDRKHAERLRAIFTHDDIEHTEQFDYEHFMKFAGDPERACYLHDLRIEQVNASTLFHLLIEDGSSVIGFEDLISGLIRLKSPATTLDSKLMLFELQGNTKHVSDQLNILVNEVQSLETRVKQMTIASSRPSAALNMSRKSTDNKSSDNMASVPAVPAAKWQQGENPNQDDTTSLALPKRKGATSALRTASTLIDAVSPEMAGATGSGQSPRNSPRHMPATASSNIETYLESSVVLQRHSCRPLSTPTTAPSTCSDVASSSISPGASRARKKKFKGPKPKSGVAGSAIDDGGLGATPRSGRMPRHSKTCPTSMEAYPARPLSGDGETDVKAPQTRISQDMDTLHE